MESVTIKLELSKDQLFDKWKNRDLSGDFEFCSPLDESEFYDHEEFKELISLYSENSQGYYFASGSDLAFMNLVESLLGEIKKHHKRELYGIDRVMIDCVYDSLTCLEIREGTVIDFDETHRRFYAYYQDIAKYIGEYYFAEWEHLVSREHFDAMWDNEFVEFKESLTYLIGA